MVINIDQLRVRLAARPFAEREEALLKLLEHAEGVHAKQLEMFQTAKEVVGMRKMDIQRVKL